MFDSVRLFRRYAVLALFLSFAIAPAQANQTPTVGSVTPRSSTAFESSFVFTFSDPDGYADLGVLNILVNDFIDGRNACYLAYSQPDNVLYLVGDAGGGLTGKLLTDLGALSNSQCAIDLSRSSASGSGNTLTLSLHIACNAAFGGDRIFYLAARDRSEANSGWRPMGTLRVPSILSPLPRVESIFPSAGAGSTHRVSVTYRDASDAQQLTPSQILINTALDGRNACYLGYDHTNNQLYLVQDAGGGLLGGVAPGMGVPGQGQMENSQCRVNGVGTTVTQSQTTYTLSVDLTYKAAFAGPKVVYAASQTTRGENSGWQAAGSWTVTAAGGGGALTSYPENGATNVPYNTRVILSLPTPVNSATVTSSTVNVFQNGSAVNIRRIVSADGRYISLQPVSGIFSPSSSFSVVATGLYDQTGAALAPWQSTFQTGAQYQPSGFYWLRSLLTDFPTSNRIKINLSDKADPTTVQEDTLVITNSVSGETQPLPCTLSSDWTSLTCQPSRPLDVGTQFSIRGESVYSIHNDRFAPYGASLKTGFDAFDTTPPSVVRIVPASSSTNVPSPDPHIFFSEPVADTWPAPNIQVTRDGLPVDVVFAPAYQDPNALRITFRNYGDKWEPNSTYKITVNNAFDRVDLPLSNPGLSSTFTTGPTIGGGSYPSATIYPGSYLRPLNTFDYVGFSEPVNPDTVTSETVRIEGPSGPVAISRVLETPTRLRLTPLAPLSPNTTYDVYVGPWVTSLNGASFQQSNHFTTGDAVDNTAPEVLSSWPFDGATGIPNNQPIRIRVSETVVVPDQGQVRLERVGGSTVSLAHYGTLTGVAELNHQPLELGQQYRLVLEGLVDLAGNPLPTYQAAFETAAQVLPADTTRPTLSSATPAAGSTDVSLNPTITLHFSEPLNTTTVDYVALATSGVYPKVDVVALDNGQTIQITPLEPLLPGRSYFVSLSSLQDWFGNRATGSYSFKTVGTPNDTTPPTLISITPSEGSVVETNGATSIPIELVFSEPVDYALLRSQLFLLWNGTKLTTYLSSRGDGIRYSSSVYPSSIQDLDGDAVISLVIGPDVEDLYGNKMGQEVRHQFQIHPQPEGQTTSYTRVMEARPSRAATSISTGAMVTLFSSGELESRGLEEKLLFSENGALIPGTISTRAGGQIVEFRPDAPFAPGALVQVFLTEQLQTPRGDKLPTSPLEPPYYFYVSGAERPFEILGFSYPLQTQTVPVNFVPRVRLSGPALPASVNASSVKLQGQGMDVPGTLHLLGNGDIIEFRPTASLTPGFYWFQVSTGLTGVSGQPLPNQGTLTFTVAAGADTQAPVVTALSPPGGSTDVPLNARVCVGFSEVIDKWSIRKEDLQLQGLGRSWTMDSVLFEDERSACFIPVEGLQPDANYSVSFSGARDIAGNSTGSASWTFRSGQTVDAQSPASLPELNLLTELPPTSSIMFHFDEPIDPTGLLSTELVTATSSTYTTVPGAWSFADGGKTAVFTPSQNLAVGTSYRFNSMVIRDLAGNAAYSYTDYFTTGFGADTTSPSVVESSPPSGATSVTPFPELTFTFDERLDPRTVGPSTVRLLDGGMALPTYAAISRDTYPAELAWRRVIVRCLCALELAKTYTVEISGVKDLSGNAIASTYRSSFTTRSAYDFAPPRLTFNLRSHGNVFRRVVAKIRSDEPLNSSSVIPERVYYSYQSQTLPGTVSLDATGTLIQLTPLQALPANSLIDIIVQPGVEDLHGNQLTQPTYSYFWTGEEEFDTEPPFVSSVNPPDGATNVPVNTYPVVYYSELFDSLAGFPTIRLLDPGGVEIQKGVLLQPGTIYTIDIPATGADFAGNLFAGAQYHFTTANSTTPDLTQPNLLSAAPAGQGVDVALDAQFELVFDEPVSVVYAFLRRIEGYNSVVEPVDIQPMSGLLRTVLRPTSLMRPGADYLLSISATDFAGNGLNPNTMPDVSFHTTSMSSDQTPPRVLSVNPPDGATGVGMIEAVLELSEPVQSTTLQNGIKVFFEGAFAPSYNVYSEGGTSVRVVGYNNQETGGVVTIVVSSALLDYAGNGAEPFVSRFEVAAPSTTISSGVLAVRPADGAQGLPQDFSFSLFFSVPIDPSTAQAATLVSENGALLAGTVEVSSNNQVLTFVPSRPYVADAEVRLFLDFNILRRATGEAYGSYLWTTRAQVGYPNFRLLSDTYLRERPRNTQIVLRFSKPLDPATVNDQTVSLSGMPAVDLILEDNNKQLRVKPHDLLPASQFLNITLGGALRSSAGETLTSQSYVQFTTTDEIAAIAPMAKLSPVDGQTGVGVNGVFVIRVDAPFEFSTINASTIQWTDGQTSSRPSMVEFVDYRPYTGQSWLAIVTPEAPLRPSTTYTVTLAGATDQAGNVIPAVSSTFTTSAGPDLAPPSARAWSPQSPSPPRNSAITIEFTEPVNPVTVHPDVLFPFVTTPADFAEVISADGRTVTLLPNEAFPEGARVGLYLNSVRDIAGNAIPGYFSPVNIYFGTEIDTTPPQVQIALPNDGALDVPMNAKIVIQFDSEIRPGGLDPAQILVRTAGAPIPIRMEIVDQGRTLELSPVGLFNPLTTYSWSVGGLLDLAGNALPAVLQGSFTTGAGALTTAPAIVNATPASGATGVPLDASWVVSFDSPISPTNLSAGLYPSGAEPSVWTLSPDGKTITVTKSEPWPPGATIQLRLEYGGLNGVRTSLYLQATTAP